MFFYFSAVTQKQRCRSVAEGAGLKMPSAGNLPIIKKPSTYSSKSKKNAHYWAIFEKDFFIIVNFSVLHNQANHFLAKTIIVSPFAIQTHQSSISQDLSTFGAPPIIAGP